MRLSATSERASFLASQEETAINPEVLIEQRAAQTTLGEPGGITHVVVARV
jgi:hypothetical protein